MINETKVKWMTKAALVKQKDEQDTFIASRFYGDDYVSFQTIKAVIGVTISFFLLVGLWALENSEELLTMYSVESLFAMAKGLLVIYVVVLLLTILISVLVYTSRFWKAKESYKEYQISLKKIQRMYQKEEKERRA